MRSSQGGLWGATAAALEIHLGLSTWLRFDQSRMESRRSRRVLWLELACRAPRSGPRGVPVQSQPGLSGHGDNICRRSFDAPNAIMIAPFSLAIFAMSIQILREVAFLSKRIGPAYETFRASGGGSRERILRREHDQQLVRYGDRFAAWRGAQGSRSKGCGIRSARTCRQRC